MALVENSLLTAAGEDALEQFQTLSTTEQAVHSDNTALGWHAMQTFTGLLEAGVKLAKEAAMGAKALEITGIETKATHVWNAGNSNTPCIVFRKLPAGVTNPKTSVAYFIVNGATNTIELSETLKGAAIKVEGAPLTTAGTEVAILASGEDNTAIGAQALERLTYGGGNTAIGELAGVNLTTGEENVVVGCEAFAYAQTVTGCTALGFRAMNGNTTGTVNIGVGYAALIVNKTGSYNIAVGNKALYGLLSGSQNTAMGHETLFTATTAVENNAFGHLALKLLTTGEANTALGAYAGESLTTGEANTLVGNLALQSNKTGNENTAVGWGAGKGNLGSGNVFLGYAAGSKETGSDKLYVASSETTTPLILGVFPNASLQFNATEMGFFKHALTTQPAKPAETTKAIIEVLEKLGLCA